MKTIVKEIHLLDIEDIEKAASAYTGVPQSINEMQCSFIYYLADDFLPKEIGFILYGLNIGDSNRGSLEDFLDEAYFFNGTLCTDKSVVSSRDLFYDEEKKGHYLNGKHLNLDAPWIPINEVFNFDTSAFGSFEINSEWAD